MKVRSFPKFSLLAPCAREHVFARVRTGSGGAGVNVDRTLPAEVKRTIPDRRARVQCALRSPWRGNLVAGETPRDASGGTGGARGERVVTVTLLP